MLEFGLLLLVPRRFYKGQHQTCPRPSYYLRWTFLVLLETALKSRRVGNDEDLKHPMETLMILCLLDVWRFHL